MSTLIRVGVVCPWTWLTGIRDEDGNLPTTQIAVHEAKGERLTLVSSSRNMRPEHYTLTMETSVNGAWVVQSSVRFGEGEEYSQADALAIAIDLSRWDAPGEYPRVKWEISDAREVSQKKERGRWYALRSAASETPCGEPGCGNMATKASVAGLQYARSNGGGGNAYCAKHRGSKHGIRENVKRNKVLSRHVTEKSCNE
jgi:hypothetical protein